MSTIQIQTFLTFRMVYSKAKLKSNGNTASPSSYQDRWCEQWISPELCNIVNCSLRVLVHALIYRSQLTLTWACLCFCGASVSPLICRDSAVRRKADSCACATLTSPAYMNSTNARRWWNATSRRNKIGCLHGLLWKEFSNKIDLNNCTVHCHSWGGQSYSGGQEMCYY